MTQASGARLYIVGAGGHGRELHSYIEDMRRNGWGGTLYGYLDDGLTPGLHGRIEVLCPIDKLSLDRGEPRHYLTAFGLNALRRKIVERITALYGNSLTPWTLVHPHT